MRIIVLSVLASITLAEPSLAQDSILWKEVNGWGVYMDPSMGNGCYVVTGYENGTILRLGFNFSESKSQIYLALGNQDWKSLEVGKEYPLRIQFDRNSPWDATANAFNMGDVNYLGVHTTEADFAEEFRRKLSLRATFQGREVAHLRLQGSSAAIGEMLNCQKAVNSYVSQKNNPPAKDPFVNEPDSKSASDPFDL